MKKQPEIIHYALFNYFVCDRNETLDLERNNANWTSAKRFDVVTCKKCIRIMKMRDCKKYSDCDIDDAGYVGEGIYCCKYWNNVQGLCDKGCGAE